MVYIITLIKIYYNIYIDISRSRYRKNSIISILLKIIKMLMLYIKYLIKNKFCIFIFNNYYINI